MRSKAEELESRRLQALEMLRQGLMPVEVARQLGVHRRSVRRWKAAARDGGRQALQARPVPGRPRKLTDAQRRQLEALLLKGALAAGFGTDLWTCARVAELIEQRFAVRYHPDHVGRLLHALGWSAQKPEPRAVERDEAAIGGWVRQDWVRIKKKPAAGVRPSSSSTKRAS